MPVFTTSTCYSFRDDSRQDRRREIEHCKTRLLIPEIWERLGLPGTPAASCRSPFREERKPSFSLFGDNRRWHDFGTGEKGDAIDFIAKACAVDTSEATRRFMAMAGMDAAAIRGPGTTFAPVSASSSASSFSKPPPPQRKLLLMPKLLRGTAEDRETLEQVRHLRPGTSSLAESLRTLGYAEVCGFPSWVLYDASRRAAEARRMDGRSYPAVGQLGERKAHSLRGSDKSWPVGLAVMQRRLFGELSSYRAILLCEGTPDYLAALHFCIEREVYDVLPMTMLGRSTGGQLHAEALTLLQGRRVRVYPHVDTDGGGLLAGHRWATQLREVGCEVDAFTFEGLRRNDGEPVKDLNDCTRISNEQQTELHHLLP